MGMVDTTIDLTTMAVMDMDRTGMDMDTDTTTDHIEMVMVTELTIGEVDSIMGLGRIIMVDILHTMVIMATITIIITEIGFTTIMVDMEDMATITAMVTTGGHTTIMDGDTGMLDTMTIGTSATMVEGMAGMATGTEDDGMDWTCFQGMKTVAQFTMITVEHDPLATDMVCHIGQDTAGIEEEEDCT